MPARHKKKGGQEPPASKSRPTTRSSASASSASKTSASTKAKGQRAGPNASNSPAPAGDNDNNGGDGDESTGAAGEPPRVQRKHSKDPKEIVSKGRTATGPGKASKVKGKGDKAVAPSKSSSASATRRSGSSVAKKRGPVILESDDESDDKDADQPPKKKREVKKEAESEGSAEDSSSSHSDDEEEQSDEGEESSDDDFENKPEEEINALLKDEETYIVDEDEIEIPKDDDHDVSMKSRSSSRMSICSSVKDDPDCKIEEDDAMTVDEDENENEIVRKRSKPKKSGRRQEKFEGELPHVKPEKRSHHAPKQAGHWPQHAQLKKGGVENQHLFIQSIVHYANRAETFKLLTQEAWPDLGDRRGYCQQVLLNAAKELRVSNPDETKDFVSRAKSDSNFCSLLGAMVVDRHSQTRQLLKKTARTEIAAFQLGKGTKCKDRVAALMRNDIYIFPGEWAEAAWKFDRTEPYQSEVIIELLKDTWFRTRTSIGYDIVKRYNDGLEDSTLIIPPGMVAIAATAIYSSLQDWKDGSLNSKLPFDGNTYATAYRKHLKSLDEIRGQNKDAYLGLLSNLHDSIVGAPESVVTSEDSSEAGAGHLWDLGKFTKKARS